MFSLAAKTTPSIIFIDDIDIIAPKDDKNCQHLRTELIISLDMLHSSINTMMRKSAGDVTIDIKKNTLT